MGNKSGEFIGMLPTGTVTFLFTDIEGSTSLWQEKPEEMAVSHARHDEILRAAIESNHGYIVQIVGDSFSAAFHNAIDGLLAILSAQRGLARMNEGEDNSSLISHSSSLTLKVRMGLHTGSAELLPDGKYDGYATIASTQRVMSAAHGGQVLLTQTTYDLLQHNLPGDVVLHDMGEHRLKDLQAPLRLYQVNVPDLQQNFSVIKSLGIQPNNLPIQLTSFIGRDKEIHEANRLFANTRLLTFIGPGGTGKTRLSLQLAENQLNEFKDGVWFIELASLTNSAYIPTTIASTFSLREVLGIPPLDIILDYVRAKQLLLILDNCEHLVETCAQLADQFLHNCPNLKIIASSREALGIGGETVYRVPSLKDDESTRLFIERAMKAEPRFTVTEQNALSITQICSRLDGIPLAIELAAARIKLFTPQQIAERLDDRFKLLTGGSRTAIPRQQTLRALIDWSYHTLNETEQRTLRRLAVFSGGWTFEGAEAVIGELEAFDGLTGLVNKSLVNVEEQEGASRYRFLETIRQYATEKLVETGEAIETRTRHLDYMLIFADEDRPNYFDIYLEWLDKLDSEHDNLRIALEWAVANDIEKAIRLGIKVGWYWSTRDYISEALFWYRTILQRSETLTGHEAERATIYSQMGWMSILVGQHREGRAAAETAKLLAKKSNQDSIVIFSCCTIALASTFLGDNVTAQNAIMEGETLAREKGLKEELTLVTSAHGQMIYFTTREVDKAKAYLDEAVRLSVEVGYRWETAFLTFGQARLAANLGDMDTARAKFNEGADIARRMGNKRMVYSNRSELAHALRENGLLDEAYEIYKEVTPGWKDLGHRAAVAHELECIGYILTKKEEPERAVTLLSAAQTIRKAIDMPRTKFEDMEYEKELSTLKGMLGEGKFQTQWDNGGRLSMDAAIELALKE
jgi:predicted ATPase/class 3 adenylate cyclase